MGNETNLVTGARTAIPSIPPCRVRNIEADGMKAARIEIRLPGRGQRGPIKAFESDDPAVTDYLSRKGYSRAQMALVTEDSPHARLAWVWIKPSDYNRYMKVYSEARNAARQEWGKYEVQSQVASKLFQPGGGREALVAHGNMSNDETPGKRVEQSYAMRPISVGSGGQVYWRYDVPKGGAANLPDGGQGFSVVEHQGEKFYMKSDEARNYVRWLSFTSQK